MRVTVSFNHTVDWKELLKSLPEDAVIDFRYRNPLRHEYFCHFISGFKGMWTMETTLVGPGLRCLMANPDLAKRCEEIVAKFEGNAIQAGLIPWLGQLVKLADLGYNVRAEVPRPVNPTWPQGYEKAKFRIDVVSPKEKEHPHGFGKSSRNCDGELALIWSDGKYYPCPWCVTGGLGKPVYEYGNVGELFENKGKQECHLRYCPLEG